VARKRHRRLALLTGAGILSLAACGGAGTDTATPCGWDTSTPEGQAAMAERLDLMSTWVVENPGGSPPPIDSPYWLGECPTSTQGPPIHEDEGQGHDGTDGHDHGE